MKWLLRFRNRHVGRNKRSENHQTRDDRFKPTTPMLSYAGVDTNIRVKNRVISLFVGQDFQSGLQTCHLPPNCSTLKSSISARGTVFALSALRATGKGGQFKTPTKQQNNSYTGVSTDPRISEVESLGTLRDAYLSLS
jgi:hypothetical protein